ncbi:unnamed protein product [Lampetra fluviatilis]
MKCSIAQCGFALLHTRLCHASRRLRWYYGSPVQSTRARSNRKSSLPYPRLPPASLSRVRVSAVQGSYPCPYSSRLTVCSLKAISLVEGGNIHQALAALTHRQAEDPRPQPVFDAIPDKAERGHILSVVDHDAQVVRVCGDCDDCSFGTQNLVP